MASFLSRRSLARFVVKKISILNLTAVFLLSFIFPGSGVFASSGNAGYIPALPATQVTAQVLNQTPVVVVAPAVAVVKQQIQSQSQPSCLMSAASAGGNLVQQTGLINFNEPAGCFSLQLSRQAAPAVAGLAVKPLAQALPKINILANRLMLSMPDLLPTPFTQTNPVIPLVAFTLLTGTVFFKRKDLKHKLLSVSSGLKLALSLEQLQMLRC